MDFFDNMSAIATHGSELRLLFVLAACTDLAQPADHGFISWLKAFMRKCYSDVISSR